MIQLVIPVRDTDMPWFDDDCGHVFAHKKEALLTIIL